MRATYLGEVVLQRRNHLGLPQEMVCEGLCTPMTLSRFEKGKQTPSRDCIEAILQRLGLPDDRYFAQLTRRETKILLLRKEALAYYKHWEQTLQKDQHIRLDALEKLHKLEQFVKKNDQITQQFILRLKALLEDHSPQERLEMLMDAIRLTSPRFNLDKISSCLYSVDEAIIISRIAISYACCGQRQKAINIYNQLFNLLLERNSDHKHLPLIAYNYALQLGLAGQLEKSLQVSEFGQKACIKQGYYYLLPKFLHIKAECFYLIGEVNRSIELYQSAYYIYGITMDTRNQEDLNADVKERFRLVF